MQLSLYLSYIYYRRLFAKGDLLTIVVLITAMVGALYVLQNADFQYFTPKNINTIEQLLMVND